MAKRETLDPSLELTIREHPLSVRHDCSVTFPEHKLIVNALVRPPWMPPILDFHVAPTNVESRHFTPQASKSKPVVTPHAVIEEIDLTRDSPEALAPDTRKTPSTVASKPRPASQTTGRKRKSEEYEADLQQRSHGHRKQDTARARINHTARESCPLVEEAIERPVHELPNEPTTAEEPPPPYSTRPPSAHVTQHTSRQVEQRQDRLQQTGPLPRSPSPQHGYAKYYSESSSTQGPSRPPSRHERRETPLGPPAEFTSRKHKQSPSRETVQPLNHDDRPLYKPDTDTPLNRLVNVDHGDHLKRPISPIRRKQSPTKVTERSASTRQPIVDSEDDEDMEGIVDTGGGEEARRENQAQDKNQLEPENVVTRLREDTAQRKVLFEEETAAPYQPQSKSRGQDEQHAIDDTFTRVKAPPSSELQHMPPMGSPQRQIMPKSPPSSEMDQVSRVQRLATQHIHKEHKEESSSSPLPSRAMSLVTSPAIEIPPDLRHVDNIILAKDSQPLIVAFAAFTSEDLAHHNKKVLRELEAVEEDFKDALDDEDEPAITDLEAKIEALRMKRDASAQIIEKRLELCQISHLRDRLKSEAFQAAGKPELPAVRTKVKAAAERAKIIEAALMTLIETAGLDVKHLTPEQVRVAVKSTQAPSRLDTSTQMIPDSTCLQTQFVQQTQAPFHNGMLRRSPIRVPPADAYRPNVEKENVRPYDYYAAPMQFPPEDDDDDYGEEADDHDLLAVEQNHQKRAMTYQASNRDVFAERSINQIPDTRLLNARMKSPAPMKTPQSAGRAPEKEYGWTDAVKTELKHTFKLRGFRRNQLNAINTTLAAKDCFVLMPTGGGKSLCYQLPSRVNTGKTRGVTIVISPLMSLMEDQVSHLKKLNIQAFKLNGDTDQQTRNIIYNSLNERNPQEFVQLLYVTPEMLGKSTALVNKLRSLYHRKQLARIVIDEAHCVSQWGHDFRPDYKNMGEICKEFDGVPLMALTATATENVKVDIKYNLGITGCEEFTQSFNRPNLFYEVRRKKGKENLLDPISEIINTSYKNQCGIVYCLSRKKCEDVAQALRQQSGINARHFHAHMEAEEKRNVLSEWQSGRVHVIVATIAFGMGIDKPDVRFVIHHSLPKSLEGYYQETGRAGRDGKPSGCFLYYSFQDCTVLKRMIEDGEGSRDQKERQLLMLRKMIGYCENEADCRRVQVLDYFNERFRSDDCGGECDNCNFSGTFETIDFTDHAASAISLVEQMQSDQPTILQCVDVFKGSMAKKVKDSRWDELREHGAGADVERTELERLFLRLLVSNAIREVNIAHRNGFTHQYVEMGPRGYDYKRKKFPIKLTVRTGGDAKVRNPKDATAKPRRTNQTKPGIEKSRTRQQPVSTNVSSPAVERQKTRRRKAAELDDGPTDDEVEVPSRSRHQMTKGYKHDGFCLPDDWGNDDEQESDDHFEPVRRSTTNRTMANAKPLSRRIEVDDELIGLNSWHLETVHKFVEEGTKLGKRIMADKKLRQMPFTATTLRRMALFFPSTEDGLKDIPDIDLQKVEHYGANFLPLIRKYENINKGGRPPDVPVYDPNKEIVDLRSSDDEAEALDDSVSSADGYAGEEASPYFQPNPQVQQMNAQIAQIESQKPRAKPRSWSPSASQEAPAAKSKSTFRKKIPKGVRKRSSKNPKSDAGGVRKRKSSTSKDASRRSNSAPRQSNARVTSNAMTRPAGAQRTMNNTGGIMAMPT